MSWTENTNSDFVALNDLIRRAVREEMGCGSNWKAATAKLGQWLGVSQSIIRMRCRDEVTGVPRTRKDLVEGCWSFREAVAKRHLAIGHDIAAAVAQRATAAQLTLPLVLDPPGMLAATAPAPACPVIRLPRKAIAA